MQIASEDARSLGIHDGDWVRVSSRRGFVEQRARIGDIGPGQVFIPFHYGYWDSPDRSRAANELTLFAWDPVSKQPHFKYAAVNLQPVDGPDTATRRRSSSDAGKRPAAAPRRSEPAREAAHIGDYLGLLGINEERLALAFEQARAEFFDVPDIVAECTLLAEWSRDAAAALDHWRRAYPAAGLVTSSRASETFSAQRRQYGLHLLLAIQNLFLIANESFIAVTILQQAAKALRNKPPLAALEAIESGNARQRRWLMSRMRLAAAQVLLVPL